MKNLRITALLLLGNGLGFGMMFTPLVSGVFITDAFLRALYVALVFSAISSVPLFIFNKWIPDFDWARLIRIIAVKLIVLTSLFFAGFFMSEALHEHSQMLLGYSSEKVTKMIKTIHFLRSDGSLIPGWSLPFLIIAIIDITLTISIKLPSLKKGNLAVSE